MQLNHPTRLHQELKEAVLLLRQVNFHRLYFANILFYMWLLGSDPAVQAAAAGAIADKKPFAVLAGPGQSTSVFSDELDPVPYLDPRKIVFPHVGLYPYVACGYKCRERLPSLRVVPDVHIETLDGPVVRRVQNGEGPVQLDLLWVQFEIPLGLAILLGFSLGLVMGLSVIYFVRVLPLRLQLRKARAALIKQDSPGEQDTPGLILSDD